MDLLPAVEKPKNSCAESSTDLCLVVSTPGGTISTFASPMTKVYLQRYGHFIYDDAAFFSPFVQRKFLDPEAAAIDHTGYAVSVIDG